MKALPDCLLYLIASVVLLTLAVPLALNQVKPNRLYGVRTKATLSSPAIWYRSNRRFGIALVVASLTYIVAIGYPCAKGIEVSRVLLLVGFLLEVGVPAFVALVSLANHDRGRTK